MKSAQIAISYNDISGGLKDHLPKSKQFNLPKLDCIIFSADNMSMIGGAYILYIFKLTFVLTFLPDETLKETL